MRASEPGVIGVPATDMLWTQSAGSIMGALFSAPNGSRVHLQSIGTTIAEKRYRIVTEALFSSPALGWVLFHDSDMVLPAGAVARLASHGLDIVSGLYVERNRLHRDGRSFVSAGHMDKRGDIVPLAARDGKVHRVDVCGGGCLFVRRTVFERIAAPWFRCNEQGINEDWDFCLAAQEAGIPVHVDTGVVAGHLAGRMLVPEGAP